MFCIWPRNTPVLFLANVRKMPTMSQPTPTASLLTHSCKSWSICCVRQLLALHSPPGRSMFTPVTNLHQMKWCGGMTFGHTKDLCHRSGCTPRDRAMWTCFCAGVSDNREFQRALWGSRRSWVCLSTWLGVGGGKGREVDTSPILITFQAAMEAIWGPQSQTLDRQSAFFFPIEVWMVWMMIVCSIY